jgi:hypothetical protein
MSESTYAQLSVERETDGRIAVWAVAEHGPARLTNDDALRFISAIVRAAAEPDQEEGIVVIAVDLSCEERTGSVAIKDDYVLITAGNCFRSHEQHYPRTGTTQITIKKGGAS